MPASMQANLERKFDLDKPWYVQYWKYVKGVFTFDLGPSLVLRNQTVNDIVKSQFPVSIELGVLAFLFAVLLGVPLGVHRGAAREQRLATTARCSSRTSASRMPELPRRDAADLLLRRQVGRHRPADERLGHVAVEDPASIALGFLPMAYFAAARARDDARDAAAGLRPHGEGEGAALAPRRQRARPAQLADPGRDRRGAAARRDHHRLVHHREHLRHPRHRPVLRHRGQRARLLGRRWA